MLLEVANISDEFVRSSEVVVNHFTPPSKILFITLQKRVHHCLGLFFFVPQEREIAMCHVERG